jgi:hypothetical protein
MGELSEEMKRELREYVLSNVPVRVFNQATKAFSVSTLYRYVKNDLMREYKHVFNGSELWFSVYMVQAFKPYQVDDIYLLDMRFWIEKVYRNYKLMPKFHPRKEQYRTEYNELVVKFNEMLAPQNELIKLYRKIQRRIKKQQTSRL